MKPLHQFVCPLVNILSVSSPTLLQGLMAPPALFKTPPLPQVMSYGPLCLFHACQLPCYSSSPTPLCLLFLREFLSFLCCCHLDVVLQLHLSYKCVKRYNAPPKCPHGRSYLRIWAANSIPEKSGCVSDCVKGAAGKTFKMFLKLHINKVQRRLRCILARESIRLVVWPSSLQPPLPVWKMKRAAAVGFICPSFVLL